MKVTFMVFNKQYNKTMPPKLLELYTSKENEVNLIKMLGDSVKPIERELIILQKVTE